MALLSVFKQREVVDAVLKPADEYHSSGLVIDKSALTVARLRKTALIELAEEMGEELSGVRGDATSVIPTWVDSVRQVASKLTKPGGRQVS